MSPHHSLTKQNLFIFLNITPTIFFIIRIPAKMKLFPNTSSYSFQAIVAACFVAFLVISGGGGSSCAQAQVSSFAFERFRCVRVKLDRTFGCKFRYVRDTGMGMYQIQSQDMTFNLIYWCLSLLACLFVTSRPSLGRCCLRSFLQML